MHFCTTCFLSFANVHFFPWKCIFFLSPSANVLFFIQKYLLQHIQLQQKQRGTTSRNPRQTGSCPPPPVEPGHVMCNASQIIFDAARRISAPPPQLFSFPDRPSARFKQPCLFRQNKTGGRDNIDVVMTAGCNRLTRQEIVYQASFILRRRSAFL